MIKSNKNEFRYNEFAAIFFQKYTQIIKISFREYFIIIIILYFSHFYTQSKISHFDKKK